MEIRKFVCTVISLAMLMNTCAPMAVLAEGETEEKPAITVTIEKASDASEEKEEEKEIVVEHKPEITFDDFAKIELRVGEVIACEEVPKSKKLLKETISFGSETRTILSGIKNWYKPEDMVGKKVVVVMNLAPRKIAGFESQGMIVAAESADGEMVSLLSPENKDIPAGSIIG